MKKLLISPPLNTFTNLSAWVGGLRCCGALDGRRCRRTPFDPLSRGMYFSMVYVGDGLIQQQEMVMAMDHSGVGDARDLTVECVLEPPRKESGPPEELSLV